MINIHEYVKLVICISDYFVKGSVLASILYQVCYIRANSSNDISYLVGIALNFPVFFL